MKSENIKAFYNLKRQVAKLSDKDLDNPSNQAALNTLLKLQDEYLEWMDAANDPEKMKATKEKMKLNDALELIAEAVSVFTQVPVPKKHDVKEYTEAFNTILASITEKEKVQ